jgi:hypothetical protein
MLEGHTADVVGRLEERGFARAHVEGVLTTAVSGLRAANAKLRTTGGSDHASVSLDASVRAADALERTLWHAQGRISEPFGPEILQMYGLDEPPPAGLRWLATYAHNVVTLLRAQPQTLEGRFGDHMETEDVARALEEPLTALDDCLATLDSSTPQARAALEARDAASQEWVSAWRGASTALEAFAALAGLGELAARAQPRFATPTNADDGALDGLELDEIEQTSSL